MTKYQLLFIIDNSLEDEAKTAEVDGIVSLIESLGGSINAVEKWGTKRFAYPIDYKNDGYYALINFNAPSDAPAEIDRKMRINDKIVRQLITQA